MRKYFVLFFLSILPMMGQAKGKTQQNVTTPPIVEVRRGGLINATFGYALWNKGKLEITVDITTPMVRRQFRITDSYAKDSEGNFPRISKITPEGIQQEPGRDYHIITDKDTARLKIVIPKMPETGALSLLRVDMSLSGTKEWVIVKDITW